MAEFKGTREAFTAAMLELAAAHEDVMFVSSDSLKAMRAEPFAEQYPDRYVETGIAEQGAVDTAAGLASCGKTPFIGTYAGFLTMRACEQMRTFVAYPNLNVKFVGINAGLVGGEREGVSHQFYEDLGILSSIPNIKLFTPADAGQAYHAIKMAYGVPGPVYVRTGSGREPDVYDKTTPFNPAGCTVLRSYGSDTVLFAGGFILDRAIAAADALHEQGIDITLADVNIMYAEDASPVLALLANAKRAFTVEDHNVNGGLGSYICHLACENNPLKVKRIGLTTFGESGPAKELADHYGFSPAAIAETIKTHL